MKRTPWHLWREDWRADSESARAEAERERRELRESALEDSIPAAEPAAAAPRRPYRTRRLLAAAIVVGVVALGVIAANALIDDGSAPDPLPAVSGEPIKPRQGQTRTGAIYEAASPAVVSIRTNSGSGTGFVIDRDGTIVTDSHVVGSNERVTVRFGVHTDSITATVLGSDPSTDIAALGIDPQSVPAGVRPLRLADSRNVRVGDRAVAIGNPFGLDRTATEGIVSAVGREIQAPNGFSIDAAIQTDAPINPGNSGGPLLDDSGLVIGVNSQIRTAGAQGNIGIGFAVPSNTVRQVVPVLVRGDTIKRAFLGLASAPASASSERGAEVQSVVPRGPASRAGLRAGDVITRVDGKQVKEPADVAAAIADDRPGDEVEIEIERDRSTVTLRATLGTRPGATP